MSRNVELESAIKYTISNPTRYNGFLRVAANNFIPLRNIKGKTLTSPMICQKDYNFVRDLKTRVFLTHGES